MACQAGHISYDTGSTHAIQNYIPDKMKPNSILAIPFTVLAIICWIFSTEVCSAQDNYFHDLKGFEDSTGTTHLYYRTWHRYSQDCVYFDYSTTFENLYNNHIYHYNTEAETDTLFLRDRLRVPTGCDPIAELVLDVEFLENDPARYYTYQITSKLDPEAYLMDYNGEYVVLGFPAIEHIEIDHENDVIVTGFMFEKSLLMPLNSSQWQDLICHPCEVPDTLAIDYGIFHIDRQGNYFVFNADTLFLTDHSGQEHEFVALGQDWESWNNLDGFTQDPGLNHYYATTRILNTIERRPDPIFLRLMKTEDGFRLDTLRTGTKPVRFTVDTSESGHLFISDSTSVLFSADYGDTFEQFMSFENPVTGLYKKPDSELLYVLTKEELLEVNIQTDESTSLKQLGVSNEPVSNTIPATLKLYQNYPNPFNPTTQIRFTLPEQSQVSLVAYDMLGREVARLIDDLLPAGEQTVRFDASGLANGVYLYRLQANQQEQVRMMTLIK